MAGTSRSKSVDSGRRGRSNGRNGTPKSRRESQISRSKVSGFGRLDGVVGGMDAATLIEPRRGLPAWMDAVEAAAALGTTPHTLRRLAREGRSPVVVRRVGGRWRFSRADVMRFVRGEERIT